MSNDKSEEKPRQKEYPTKTKISRLILKNGNQLMTPEEIGQKLKLNSQIVTSLCKELVRAKDFIQEGEGFRIADWQPDLEKGLDPRVEEEQGSDPE